MERPTLQGLLETTPLDKPYVATVPGTSGNMDLTQTLYPPEETLILVTSRYLKDHIERENPRVHVETTMKFASTPARRLSLVVIMGAATVGKLGSKTNKLLHQTWRRGARMMLISSIYPNPENVYAVAYALGVHKEMFGSYQEFVDRNFIRHPGARWGANWLKGIIPGRVGPLAEQARQMMDLSRIADEADRGTGVSAAALGEDRSGVQS